MDFGFREKIIIITGAAAGIGSATAELFAHEGAKVMIADLDSNRGKEIEKKIQNHSGYAEFHPVNITREEEVQKMVHSIITLHHQIDVLVNNAGLYAHGDALSFNEEIWEKIVSVNIKGVLWCIKHVGLQMIKQNRGVIVNVASEAGLVGIANQIVYNLTKAAVISITQSCAIDLIPYGIRTNCICPGTTLTPLVEESLVQSSDPLSVRQKLENSRPIQRLGKPEEIATAILALSSEVIGYAHGTIMNVDGGYTIW
ncbi:SDR family NAD(P)-dependent oxidoreductase [Atribacter laminatus]|uniref:Dihydroanticapsin 7-dehydrogenase n=1 Tax=Atribacter laminatus TaxID=2847778 RepID=A0A7T1F327_ATRLM|nr:SDR family oxidoreductase [Atribacter laminatus]QPM68663.1 Dihydroanticapsin 7-dehydrogenase [Atribacter laminatus]